MQARAMLAAFREAYDKYAERLAFCERNIGLSLEWAYEHMTQRELAKQLNVTPQYLCYLRNGRNKPSPALLLRLLEISQGHE
jgi:transcriptional regulator with XRE-family HTH domain